MKLRAVFFGNSRTVFSNRHYGALMESACAIVAAVDAPSAQHSSTNPAQSPFPPFATMARNAGIPVFEPANPNAPDFVDAVRAMTPDLFMAVGYTKLLKSPLLNVPRVLAANFHASLLPAYRGLHPVFWALRHGETRAGLTVHVMDEGLDTGDIIYQVRVPTRKRDSVQTLYDRIMARSVPLVPRLVEEAGDGQLPRRPQPWHGASYYSHASEDDFRLDWSETAEHMRRWIHTTPGKCFTEIASRRVFLVDAEVESHPSRKQPGTILRMGRSCCVVATGKNALRLRAIRVEQFGDTTLAELCRKMGIGEGTRLE